MHKLFHSTDLKKVFGKILLYAIVLSLILTGIGYFIPNQKIMVGLEGEGERQKGKGFPNLIVFSGSDKYDNFAANPKEVLKRFIENCKEIGGFFDDTTDKFGLTYGKFCRYENIFSRSSLINNLLFWFFISFVVVTLVITKKSKTSQETINQN